MLIHVNLYRFSITFLQNLINNLKVCSNSCVFWCSSVKINESLNEFHRSGVSTRKLRSLKLLSVFFSNLLQWATSKYVQIAKSEKEYKPQYLHLLTKITCFLECTDSWLENQFLKSTSKWKQIQNNIFSILFTRDF